MPSWPYILPLLVSALLSALLSLAAWRRRPAAGAWPFALLMLGVFVWTLGYALELGAGSLADKVLWAKVEYLGIACVPVFWLLFALEYAGKGKWLTRRSLALLSVIPLLTILAVWTNERHGLVWRQVELAQTGPLKIMSVDYGYWFYVFWAFSNLTIALTSLMLVRSLLRSLQLYRRQSYALLVGVLMPWAGNALYVLDLNPLPGLDLTPFAFALSGLAVGWSYLRHHLLELVPIARDHLVEGISDGVLVLDDSDRLVDMNLAGRLYLNCSPAEALGQSLQAIFPGSAGLFEDAGPESLQRNLVVEQGGPEPRFLDLRSTPLYRRSLLRVEAAPRKPIGRLILIRDITEARRAEAALQESEQKLRTVITGAPLVLFALDAQGVFTLCEGRGLQLLGALPSDIVGKSVFTLSGDIPGLAADVRRALSNESFRSGLEIEGTEFELQFSPILDPAGIVAGVIGVAMDVTGRKRAEEALVRRTEELSALHAIALDITATDDLSDLLQTIVVRAARLINASGGGLYLQDHPGGDLRCVVSHNPHRDYTDTVLKPGEGAAGMVVETGEALIIDDYRESDPGSEGDEQEQPFSNALIVPLKWQSQVIGVIHLLNDLQDRHFGKSDLELLTLFANYAAIAIENTRLIGATQASLRKTETLYSTAQLLISSQSLAQMLTTVVDGAARALPADRVTLVTLDREKGQVTEFVFGGPGADRVVRVSYEELMKGLTGVVVREGEAVLSTKGQPDAREQPEVQRRREETDCGSIIVVPLRYRGRMMGTMTAINRPRQADFTEQDVDLLLAMANQAVVAIENAQLFDEVQRQAVTDPLTRLYNRRGLFDLGQREVERAQRFGRPLSAMMLDLDHFKDVNDRYGHYIGDQVLREIAARCEENLRKVDLLGRYGGEEFAILLPETDLQSARLAAERVHHAINGNPVATDRGALQITVSIGVTQYTGRMADLAALLDAADAAMYAAKRAGRDCVILQEFGQSESAQPAL